MHNKHKGALSELIASAWLLGKGYGVFRNVSQHGDADLIIEAPTGEFFKVDVKSTSKCMRRDGSVKHHNRMGDFGVVFVLIVDPDDGSCVWNRYRAPPGDESRPYRTREPGDKMPASDAPRAFTDRCGKSDS